jgi:low temperature requirement protein LtrA
MELKSSTTNTSEEKKRYGFFQLRINAMQARDMEESHRASTPLELLFDLVSVIAIAAAAAGLHHALAEAHYLQGIVQFCAAFFAIWWAWMNYTWFASAYDNDDTLFRIFTMIIMAGALTMAAGIPPFFARLDLSLIVIGYVIMRLAMVAFWLRASIHDPQRRKTTLTYALGISLAQVYWVIICWMQLSSVPLFFAAFGLGILIELSVPAVAERFGTTPWHRHHIVERYGLLNIIVLGETLLAGSLALNQLSLSEFDVAYVHLAISSLVILFSLWWLYFSKEEQLQHQELKRALTWGYGHLIIYLAGAAVGAGFAVLVDIIAGNSNTPILIGDYAVAVPVALYLLGIWFVRDRFVLKAAEQMILPVFALIILLTPPLLALEGIALFTLLSVIVRTHFVCKTAN